MTRSRNSLTVRGMVGLTWQDTVFMCVYFGLLMNYDPAICKMQKRTIYCKMVLRNACYVLTIECKTIRKCIEIKSCAILSLGL